MKKETVFETAFREIAEEIITNLHDGKAFDRHCSAYRKSTTPFKNFTFCWLIAFIYKS